jgi:hypothetical protein
MAMMFFLSCVFSAVWMIQMLLDLPDNSTPAQWIVYSIINLIYGVASFASYRVARKQPKTP